VKLGLVLSDLHIGTGHRKGEINVYDDFREDDRLEQLLQRFSTGSHENDEIHLVLNGDIFDLLKVPVNGKFPDAITERLAITKLEQCLAGHPRLARGLSDFLRNGKNRITYQPGNHDMELFFAGCQRLFCRAVTGQDAHERLSFVPEEPHFTLHGVQFHHGHQFEAIHAFDFKKLFISRGQREPILNLPWGSLFILHVVNSLVKERPHLDKVMPFWPLFIGGMLFDTRFTSRMIAECLAALVRARINPNWWRKRPFEKVSRFFQNQVGFFENLDGYAHRMLSPSSDLSAVFMGHTHMEMVRSFARGKVYINTGTWMPMINLRLANLGQHLALHYGLIEWPDDGPPRASLHRWHGRRAETEEVIS
jgi:UDP-2,3-diacylglucosamine pyrophosphatase LpxH